MISFTTVEDSMEKEENSVEKEKKAEPSSPTFEEIREYLGEMNPEALLADGLEDALIGVCDRFGQPALAAYDYDKCIEILAEDIASDETLEEDDDPHTMAVEHFDFNIIGGWVGESTPVFIRLYETQKSN